MNLNHIFVVSLGLLISAQAASAALPQAGNPIPVVVSETAPLAERLVARELAGYLRQLFPKETFAVAAQLPGAGPCIRLGDATDAEVTRLVPKDRLAAAESFVVTNLADGPRQVGVIAGADARGVAHGVYALLEKLGCGFFLSGDVLPAAQAKAFSFDGWALADRPLVGERIVLNWHNFLSSCSTWNLADWNRWTSQSQKMGYNAIMVHAYGNNPMAAFEFNGQQKPVGYLSTTVKGRDWSTTHVNDVRRLWGGEVFTQAAFGADAALVADEERVEAAQKLMREVFAHASERGMGVFFAVDVDTPAANPQELVRLLPESARFAIKGQTTALSGPAPDRLWLPNPDTPEGYAFFRAEVAGLLQQYPQITTLVAWFRAGGTPWVDLKAADLPAAWQQEFAAEIARTPEAAKYWRAPGMFAVGKIVRAFERALKECGASQTRVAAGTWLFDFLHAADRFFPAGVPLIGLDFNVMRERPQLGSDATRAPLREIGARRPVIPIAWAHHDDSHYIGRPYTPLDGFASKLEDAKASGFGIIHWTTRPLDLYFASLVEQVWQSHRDQPLRATCDEMAERSFGPVALAPMGEYLLRWITEAPRFGRDTTDHFIDRQLTNIAQTVAGCRARLKLIAAVDAARLTPEQRDRLDYFKGLEEFIIAFHETHDLYQCSQAALKQGDLGGARKLMEQCRPEPVIEQFAKFSSLGGITRGEQGLVVSMNLRWLPHLLRHRQALGIEPVRIRFGPTQHDKLAQLRGTLTFHFGPDRKVWECRGAEETGASVFVLPEGTVEERGRTGIESEKPLKISLQPFMALDNATSLQPGDYRLRLLMLDPISTAPGQRVFSIATSTDGRAADRCDFAPVKARYLRLACRGNSENDWNSIEEVELASLAKDAGAPVVTASQEMKDYPATAAADGQFLTRWTTRGRDEWIQFRLDPAVATDHISISWYGPETWKEQFEILVSDDGQQWKPVDRKPSVGASTVTTNQPDVVDIFAETGGTRRLLERAYDVKLTKPGRVTVTLTPIKGRALICSAMLEPKNGTSFQSGSASRGVNP